MTKKDLTPLQAIQRYCLYCADSAGGAMFCNVHRCPLYNFRLGYKFERKSLSRNLEKICLVCAGKSGKRKKCTDQNCVFSPCKTRCEVAWKEPENDDSKLPFENV